MHLTARNYRLLSSNLPLFSLGIAMAAALMVVTCGTTNMTTVPPTNQMGTINVSLSDPPTCSAPAGNFQSVFITIRSVQAHVSATAGDNSPGWWSLYPN